MKLTCYFIIESEKHVVAGGLQMLPHMLDCISLEHIQFGSWIRALWVQLCAMLYERGKHMKWEGHDVALLPLPVHTV